jgi:hypothetical protein
LLQRNILPSFNATLPSQNRAVLLNNTESEQRQHARTCAAIAEKLVKDVELAKQGSAKNATGQLFLHQGVAAQQSASPNRLLKDDDEPVDSHRNVAARLRRQRWMKIHLAQHRVDDWVPYSSGL